MRIRSTKPEFWQDEKMARELSRDARLLYKALWNEADDQGRLRGVEAYLHGTLFPYDPGSWFADSLAQLVQTGRVVRYEADGGSYMYLPKLVKHQKIDHPGASRLPPPPDDARGPREDLATDSRTTRAVAGSREQVAGSREQVAGSGPPDKPAGGSIQATDDQPKDDGPTSKTNGKVKEVFGYWTEKLGHPAARLDRKREARIEWALKTYDEEACRLAIDGCASDPFSCGENDRHQRYDDVTIIFRDAQHVEKFVDLAGQKKAGGEEPGQKLY